MIRRLLQHVTKRDLIIASAAALLAASFAIPAFNGYVERGRVSRAVSDIGTLSLQLYRFQRDSSRLPEDLAEAGLGGDDPWGRPYVYVRAEGTSQSQLRKDAERAPLNSDFDLYSLGADGVSALALPAAPAHDDIVRANDGAFIGLAVNY